MNNPRRHSQRRSQIQPVAILLAMLLGLLFSALAAAEHNVRGRSRSSSERSSGHHSAYRSQNSYSQQNRHLLPPVGLGSATNAPPGFYQQLNAPPASRQLAPVYLPAPRVVAQPQVVYVVPPEYGVSAGRLSPVQYAAPSRRDAPPPPAPPAPAPQPIYIVQQAPAAASPPTREPAVERPARPAPPPRPREPVAVTFAVRPADAEVFLEEDLLGTGAELAGRETAMRLHPGVYVLEVSHPEHPLQRLVFGVGGDSIEVAIDLTAERADRRSRIR